MAIGRSANRPIGRSADRRSPFPDCPAPQFCVHLNQFSLFVSLPCPPCFFFSLPFSFRPPFPFSVLPFPSLFPAPLSFLFLPCFCLSLFPSLFPSPLPFPLFFPFLSPLFFPFPFSP